MSLEELSKFVEDGETEAGRCALGHHRTGDPIRGWLRRLWSCPVVRRRCGRGSDWSW